MIKGIISVTPEIPKNLENIVLQASWQKHRKRRAYLKSTWGPLSIDVNPKEIHERLTDSLFIFFPF